MNPKISIITITYNSEKTLEETIKSVISQEYDNLEYLIIDGGSTDHTLDIVNKYRENIDIFVSEPDNGISDAFNKGIQKATGEIIGIINSDDILLPKALLTISEYYTPDIDIYSGNVLMWNDETNQTYVRKPDMEYKGVKQRFKACHPARFITRKAYKKYGTYSLEYSYCMDVDLLIRFYRHGAKAIHIEKLLVKFRIGATSSDSVFKKKSDIYKIVINNNGSKWDFYCKWTKCVINYFGKKIATMLLGNNLIGKLQNLKNQ